MLVKMMNVGGWAMTEKGESVVDRAKTTCKALSRLLAKRAMQGVEACILANGECAPMMCAGVCCAADTVLRLSLKMRTCVCQRHAHRERKSEKERGKELRCRAVVSIPAVQPPIQSTAFGRISRKTAFITPSL